jgi:alpha-beta hydrolase superfamily lysophospholipase
MGGGILASIALRRPELFDGMILDAPMLYANPSLDASSSVTLLPCCDPLDADKNKETI